MNDEPDSDKVVMPAERVSNLVAPMRAAEEAQEARLKSMGIEYEIKETPMLDEKTGAPVVRSDGTPVIKRTLIITGIPQAVREVNNFFIKSVPCWFPGCEGLRAQYDKDLEALGGAGCPSCKQGALMRRYQDIVSNAINKSKNKNAPVHTGSGEMAGPSAGGATGTGGQPSMLRRAADRVAKIFGIGKGT